MSNNNNFDLEKRRSERLDSAIGKMDNILDHTKVYKMDKNTDKMKKVLKNLNSKIKVKNMSGLGKNNRFTFLNVKSEYESFVSNIMDSIFGIYEDIVCRELTDIEKDLISYLEYSEPNRIKEYKKNIREIVGLASIEKNKKMDKYMFEIEKDLIACLKYNDKIENNVGV